MSRRVSLKRILMVLFAILFVAWMAGCAGGTGSSDRSIDDIPTGGPGTGGGGGGTGGGGGGTGGGGGGGVVPPLGDSSGGSGGPKSSGSVNANGVSCRIIVPSSYSDSKPNEFLIVYSGTEGGAQMYSNLLNLRSMCGLGSFIIAVLDGKSNSAGDGATVLDWARASYNIDNDKTSLLSESAGTPEGQQLGFSLRQSYFAAYWVNDVAGPPGSPDKTASELGFAPHGNAGPGGAFAAATAIVDAMRAAGYRLPADAPYSGSGAGSHGSPDQFMAALKFFPGKSRQ